ncbi:hypothetical protein [Burkholderia sp. LMG 32019]
MKPLIGECWWVIGVKSRCFASWIGEIVIDEGLLMRAWSRSTPACSSWGTTSRCSAMTSMAIVQLREFSTVSLSAADVVRQLIVLQRKQHGTSVHD